MVIKIEIGVLYFIIFIFPLPSVVIYSHPAALAVSSVWAGGSSLPPRIIGGLGVVFIPPLPKGE
jgi:hypothetical protein